MTVCGQLWPDHLWDDGRPVTCHLQVEDHNPIWHCWWHELHVEDGQEFGDGRIAWHTAFALTITDNAGPLTPTKRIKAWHTDEEGHKHPLHEVVAHPMNRTLRRNLPPKPAKL